MSQKQTRIPAGFELELKLLPRLPSLATEVHSARKIFMNPSSLSQSSPLLNMSVVNELRDMDSDGLGLLAELMSAFVLDTTQLIGKLRVALHQKDSAEIARAAHTLKGSSSNVGAASLSQIALAVEVCGKEGNLAGIPSLLDELDCSFSLAETALRNAFRCT